MDDHPQVKLEGLLDGKASVGFPAFDLKEGMYGFFPYNMKLNDAVLHTALATPLCVLHTKKGDAFVFTVISTRRFSGRAMRAQNSA